jgi:hypothetical protein
MEDTERDRKLFFPSFLENDCTVMFEKGTVVRNTTQLLDLASSVQQNCLGLKKNIRQKKIKSRRVS